MIEKHQSDYSIKVNHDFWISSLYMVAKKTLDSQKKQGKMHFSRQKIYLVIQTLSCYVATSEGHILNRPNLYISQKSMTFSPKILKISLHIYRKFNNIFYAEL